MKDPEQINILALKENAKKFEYKETYIVKRRAQTTEAV